jgi:hypothetical protein
MEEEESLACSEENGGEHGAVGERRSRFAVKDGGSGCIHPGPFDADAAMKVFVRVAYAHPCIPKSSIFATAGAVYNQQLPP